MPSDGRDVIPFDRSRRKLRQSGLEFAGDPPDPPDMEARVAVLEEIAKGTKEALAELRAEMRALRTEQRTDYRWMLGVLIGGFVTLGGGMLALLGIMAKGFKWL